ncbi:hypothetical protein MD588_25635 [Photobacterium sp. SDRW27]|uniref:hypothetical protein n=1 Tax=Photobacterium obscurum TaxID=2829490 RepID=UPI002243A178|nr:hypothetical protein [Photobacterium obscurum]MCW8332174.1 hypothetical protein [Photobacterium obscurum]
MNPHFKRTSLLICLVACTSLSHAEEGELQDMSNPLAVYSTAGIGVTDKGVNVKLGQSYDVGKPGHGGMNILEIKGIGGDALGFRDSSVDQFSNVDDSIDSVRFRNFNVDFTKMRGRQIDVNYDVATDSFNTSYSVIQGAPAMGKLKLYPLAGLGLNITNEVDVDPDTGNETKQGYKIPGTFAMVGMYSTLQITDNIWFNYNPMYMLSLSGSDIYTKHGFSGDSDVLNHEAALSYQINPRTNIRYFSNWSDKVSFSDGDHRIEINYQF